MRFALNIVVAVFLLSSFVSAQQPSREAAFEEIESLNRELRDLEDSFLQPSPEDLKRAQSSGLFAFRILPREKYDGKLTIRGGGAYYSFSKRSNSYDSIPEIQLERGYLSVGFAGADYGFIADLGGIAIENLTDDTPAVKFLVNYEPPSLERDARREQGTRTRTVEGLEFSNRLPAKVGRSYVLRSISYDRADIAVAFRLVREDRDGSLIIFWRPIMEFAKPILERNVSVGN